MCAVWNPEELTRQDVTLTGSGGREEGVGTRERAAAVLGEALVVRNPTETLSLV